MSLTLSEPSLNIFQLNGAKLFWEMFWEFLKIFYRLESYGIWSTSKRAEYKKRGYIEVRALLPAKTNGQSLKGAWPAIWMLGYKNGHYWPKYGEIDMGKHQSVCQICQMSQKRQQCHKNQFRVWFTVFSWNMTKSKFLKWTNQ